MSLFGGATTQARARNLVEFKAGKMNLRGNMVFPDKRKGLVYLYQGNDMLMHLCWKDRSGTAIEDDLVIFPDEVEYKKVTQNTTGRVYVLKWKSNARKFFFWMQEPKEDKDEEYCKKINDLLNNPPTPGFGDSGSGAHPLQPLMERMAGGGAGGIDPNDLSNVLRGMDPNDFASLLSSFGRGGGGAASLMQGLQRSGGSSAASSQQRTASSRANTSADSRPATATRAAATSRVGASSTSTPSAAGGSSAASSSTPSNAPKTSGIQMSALTSVLTNLNTSTTESTASKASSVSSETTTKHEALIPLLSNKNVQEKLRPHLPDGHSIPSTEQALRDASQTPQFRQMVDAFGTALQSGELRSLLSQLNLPEEVLNAANRGDLQAFTQALEKHAKSSSDNTMDTN